MVISNPHASLLEKLNLTLDQLDYKYIENCKNVKQLEKILRVLRSGEEGVFPHLIKFCEARLQQVDPSNKYLLSAQGIMNYSDLPEEEKENILAGIEDWSNILNESVNASTNECQKKEKSEQKINETKNKICKPRSYQEWDKFDVEGELEKLEDKNEVETEEKVTINKYIPVTGLSAAEREHIANLERIKGNEAFKAQDYEEAVLYYTRSLSALRSVKTLNNRAQTHLKLRNYLEAVIDCNEVISMEPNNIKALSRRGIAHKEAQMFDLAVIDFEIILRLEPENKSAKDQLKQIENSMIQKPEEKRKVVIEELESETLHNGDTNESAFSTEDGKTSKRLAIEEITESPRQMLDEICDCHVSDDNMRPLSKNTKEMLSIFKTEHKSIANTKKEKVIVEETENQLSQGNSKSIAMINDFDISKMPSEKANTKTGFKNIKIQSELEYSSINKQNNRESFIKEKVSNSPIKIEEMYSELSKTSKTETVEDNDENRVLHSTKEIFSKAEEYKNEEHSMTTKFVALHRVSPFEFLQVWLSNNCNSNSKNGAACLLAVKPQELPKILTNKLDGPLLSSLLKAIKYLFNAGKLKESLEYMKFLLEVPRIKLTALFLSSDEKNDVKDLLIIMENQLGHNLDHARKVLSIN
ncbi:Sperm-associated antigen 1 like protein [Argiope bruennichi]|uniref:Sperm-associated antigen 1 like protein n=1 Tax=Argiope bruennichi TaxID=94029 RepID=A0A8T0ESP9_ARGBR|nr:Sperm-associated antigen 1 like protein [Argiope bruennichi]